MNFSSLQSTTALLYIRCDGLSFHLNPSLVMLCASMIHYMNMRLWSCPRHASTAEQNSRTHYLIRCTARRCGRGKQTCNKKDVFCLWLSCLCAQGIDHSICAWCMGGNRSTYHLFCADCVQVVRRLHTWPPSPMQYLSVQHVGAAVGPLPIWLSSISPAARVVGPLSDFEGLMSTIHVCLQE